MLNYITQVQARPAVRGGSGFAPVGCKRSFSVFLSRCCLLTDRSRQPTPGSFPTTHRLLHCSRTEPALWLQTLLLFEKMSTSHMLSSPMLCSKYCLRSCETSVRGSRGPLLGAPGPPVARHRCLPALPAILVWLGLDVVSDAEPMLVEGWQKLP